MHFSGSGKRTKKRTKWKSRGYRRGNDDAPSRTVRKRVAWRHRWIRHQRRSARRNIVYLVQFWCPSCF